MFCLISELAGKLTLLQVKPTASVLMTSKIIGKEEHVTSAWVGSNGRTITSIVLLAY